MKKKERMKSVQKKYEKLTMEDMASALCTYLTSYDSKYNDKIADKIIELVKESAREKMKEYGEKGRKYFMSSFTELF